jgi:hypothetical protein
MKRDMTRRTLLKLAAMLPFAGPWLAKVLAQPAGKPQTCCVPYLPAHFPKWNRAVDGLEDAGNWALDLEWSRIRTDAVLPIEGQIWEAVRDCEVPLRASISRAPISAINFAGLSPAGINLLLGSATARLCSGERVRIVESGPKPVTVRFVPVRYEQLHDSLVPLQLRHAPGYSGYTLQLKLARTVSDSCKVGSLSLTFFSEAFRLVPGPRCSFL